MSARGPGGARWRAEQWEAADGQAMRSLLRRLMHLIVLSAAVAPITVTVASARPAANVHGRLEMQSPQSMLASMAYASAAYVAVSHDSPREANAPTQLAPAPVAAHVSVPAPAPGGSRGVFPRGYCTWYVSTRRYIPWSGNAGDWYGAARAMGFEVGSTPRPGAIMVSRESWIGHVAFVESVSGNSFVVSEMNFRGFGVVDERRIILGHVPLIGFIY